MILLVTNRTDITTDHVVAELRRRGASFFRLNTEDLATARIGWLAADGRTGWTITDGGRTIDLASVEAAYLRRPKLPELSMLACAGERDYALREWAALLDAIYAELDDRWLNRPAAIARAENKLGQIEMAGRLGFQTPATLVTNDPIALDAFVGAARSIVKPLRNGSIAGDDDSSVIFTTRLKEKLDAADDEAIKVAPFIAQHEIEKDCDVRVTVVGEMVFAAEIQSQHASETETDWRRGDVLQLRHRAHVLPDEIRERAIELVRTLGLRFGAIDLVLDRHGAYWFLEINPNGQWAWIETLTGLPITSAIVDELQRTSRT